MMMVMMMHDDKYLYYFGTCSWVADVPVWVSGVWHSPKIIGTAASHKRHLSKYLCQWTTVYSN